MQSPQLQGAATPLSGFVPPSRVFCTGNQTKSYLKCLYCYTPKYLTIKFHPPPACLPIYFMAQANGSALGVSPPPRLRGEPNVPPRPGRPTGEGAAGHPSRGTPLSPGPPLLRALRSDACAAAVELPGRRAGAARPTPPLLQDTAAAETPPRTCMAPVYSPILRAGRGIAIKGI